ncbi:MAG TPA: hypothetical protein VML55_21565, partial [Planctomycetaceae bacterium]|nr:hypothetical protein [Planctomycetaceae bacterium]
MVRALAGRTAEGAGSISRILQKNSSFELVGPLSRAMAGVGCAKFKIAAADMYAMAHMFSGILNFAHPTPVAVGRFAYPERCFPFSVVPCLREPCDAIGGTSNNRR